MELIQKYANAARLSLNYEKTFELTSEIHKYAKHKLEKLKAYETELYTYIIQNKAQETLNTIIKYFKLVDINFPKKPTIFNILKSILFIS